MVVRGRLSRTSVEKASNEILQWQRRYLKAGEGLTEEQGRTSVTVPESIGVDADMTSWSYYQLLAHNTIVNRAISMTVCALLTGDGKDALDQFNPKTDTLPSSAVGPEQCDAFSHSITEHIEMVSGFKDLKTEETHPHPLFGDFNAHMWHAMLGFHLGVHASQLKKITARKGSLKGE